MSVHNWFLFPANLHFPAPDWQALEQRMLEQEMLLPAAGNHVPFKALHELSFAIMRGMPGVHWLRDDTWRTAADVVNAYVAAGHLSKAVSVRPDATVETAVDLLRAQGITVTDEWRIWEHSETSWWSPRHSPGPGMRRFYTDDVFERERRSSIVLFSAKGDKPYIIVGENTWAPAVPGRDEDLERLEPFGGWEDFIGAAYEDINATWVDPVDDRRYRIMELDWHEALGVGWHFMKFEDGGDFDHDRFADAISKIAGQPMMFTYCHT